MPMIAARLKQRQKQRHAAPRPPVQRWIRSRTSSENTSILKEFCHDERPTGGLDETSPANAGRNAEKTTEAGVDRSEGTAGAGLVKVVMSCNHEVRRVSIDPSVLDEDKEMLEDLVAAAFNDALRKA